jgi:hypothetical protein
MLPSTAFMFPFPLRGEGKEGVKRKEMKEK